MSAVEQSYRYIGAVEGVRSGRPLVAGTRIGVHDVVGLFLTGASVDDVVKSFPALTRAQVYECLAYYEDHKAEIDPAVAEQMATGQRPVSRNGSSRMPLRELDRHRACVGHPENETALQAWSRHW